jgi:hypothetical protein
MTDFIITLSIWWVAEMNAKTLSVASVAGTLVAMSLANWIENNAMLDSIIMNMIDRRFVPPVAPESTWSEVVLTSQNTFNILNTIKLVTRAFTVIDS